MKVDQFKLEQYACMLDDTDMQLWILKDTETYGFVNQAHADFLGKEKKDIENKKLWNVLNEKEAQQCIYSNIKAQQSVSKNVEVFQQKEKIISKEWITNSEGELRLLHITKTPILDEENNVKYIVGKAYDLTEEEERKNKCAISEQQYGALVENQTDFICRFLPNGELTYANKAFCCYLNKQYEELVGKSVLTVVPKDEHEKIKKSLQSFSIEKPIQTYAHSVIDAIGNISWIRWTNQAFFSENGEIIEFQSVGTDITELKNAKKVLEKKVEENKKILHEVIEYDKLKTEFFSNISHELRTPLNLILSTIQLIDYQEKNHIKDLKLRTKLKSIVKQNCYRLLRLINNLIDVTKIDSGYFNMNLGNYNIVSIVEEITLSVSEYIKNKHIHFCFDTNVEEKIMACDPDHIERIILNLLSNAVKFTRLNGNIMVNIYDKGKSIIISVKDTGIGIPKDKQNIIFDRFRQIDKSFTRNHEGSGIGLSLVQSLVKMYKGEIIVKSEENKGSEFIVELPVKILENDIKEVKKRYNNDYVESINIEFSDIYSIE
ncbi:PAS domain-containing sensor histidine kinase [Crassaminicella profunda]|uniref:PAS domain-containing sensor histidine kinase n=1 Tax=Crassaminicella profunda TaxID=1286698 RepID=UPI001CA7A220|nr:ATP-binding protein [Crassaminicella profunda]QZY54693.1 PAS domain S-box protein [Crassaminicella profunda]